MWGLLLTPGLQSQLQVGSGNSVPFGHYLLRVSSEPTGWGAPLHKTALLFAARCESWACLTPDWQAVHWGSHDPLLRLDSLLESAFSCRIVYCKGYSSGAAKWKRCAGRGTAGACGIPPLSGPATLPAPPCVPNPGSSQHSRVF